MNTDAAAQAYLAAIITSSNDAIISKDLNGNITSWNPAAERIFGYTAEEAVGRHITMIIPPERQHEEDMIISKLRKGERIDHFETVRRAKDGRMLELSVTISPIRGENGQIIGASKVARDISIVRQAEHDAAYLSAIVESSDDAIISKNLDGIITSWNASAERIFGYTAEEAIGRHITFIIPPERQFEEDTIIARLKKGERIEHFETVRVARGGRLFPISITVSPIRDGSGNVIGASKVARDISERVTAERSLKEMARKKDEFLANMSHELRTPMNAVIGLANLLEASASLSERDRKFVQTLKLSADNLLALINDLLDFARIEAGQVDLEETVFSLPELIEQAMGLVSVRAREKELELSCDYPRSLPSSFVGDPLRIQQIVVNLLSNAVKFTEKGGVDIAVEANAHQMSEDVVYVSLAVSDTGIGIPRDKLPHIFEKFTQADASFTRRYGGSGLGLSISNSLAQAMGGGIGVASEEGLGTTFTLMLPLKRSEDALEPVAESSLGAFRRTHKNVLLVEDYEPNVLVAGEMLSLLGYDYDVATNGLDALKKFLRGQYDVVLMDVQMPELDGLEATRRIRQTEGEKGLVPTPIIAMTAHVREQDKDRCMEAGMDDFIPKPFEPSLLSETLGRYLGAGQAA